MRPQCEYLPSGYRCALLPKRMNSNRLRWEMRKKSVGLCPPPPRLTSFRNHWGEWWGSTNRQASHGPCQQLFTSYKLLPQSRSQSLHSSATHDPLLCRDQGAFCPHFVTSGVLVREKPAAPPPQVYLCNKGLNLDASWAVYGVCNPRW